MKLEFSNVNYTIYQFCPNKVLASEVLSRAFSWTRTADELSLVAISGLSIGADQENAGWRCFRVAGQLDFDMIGVLSRLSQVLAVASLSIFVISTYNTDYVFLKATDIASAKACLAKAGHTLSDF